MAINPLIKGLIVGFSIAAPVGPIGVLCIRRTLANGRASGFITGLGAATADGMYALVAGFGLTFISSVLVNQQSWFRLIGGIFLLCLGIRIFLSKPAEGVDSEKRKSLLGDYVSTFFLTLMNPTTILSFVAIFAGLGLGDRTGSYLSASILVLGVLLGSGCWWFILSGGISLLRSKFNSSTLRWVNRVSGSVIGIFGLLALISVIGD